jgi:hypothetical protein
MNNLRSIIIAIAASGVVSSAALAENPVTQQLTIGGTVNALATFPEAAVESGTSLNATLAGGAITIAAIADVDLHPNATSISVSYANVSTNYKAKIGLYSAKNGLRTDTPADTEGFTNRVDYTAAVTLSGVSGNLLSFTTAGDEATMSAVTGYAIGPFNGATITVNVTINGSNAVRLVQGAYSDTLQLKIGSTL